MKIKFNTNGNRVLALEASDLAGARGFSIQTLGNLPQTHRDGIGNHTLPEVGDYLKKHGSKRQKEAFGIPA